MRVELRSDLPDCKECGAGELMHVSSTNVGWKSAFLEGEADALGGLLRAYQAAAEEADALFAARVREAEIRHRDSVMVALSHVREDSIREAVDAFARSVGDVKSSVPRFRVLKRRWVLAMAARVEEIERELAEASRR